MRPILSPKAMQEADRKTIHEIGLPSFTLMESTGRAASQIIEQNYGNLKEKNISIFCGTGNNGGDGLVIARNLAEKGAFVQIVLAEENLNNASEDFLLNWKILKQIITYIKTIEIKIFDNEQAECKSDLIIDALLGTGFKNNLKEKYKQIITRINHNSAYKIALDLPSGLNSETGLIPQVAVKADLTITLAAPKIGLLIGEGPKVCGKVKTAEIGIPNKLLEEIAINRGDCAFEVEAQDIQKWLPKHEFTVHKYQRGAALIIAGSKGMSGAAYMAAMASAKIGTGIVTCACPEEIQNILAAKFTEILTINLNNLQEAEKKANAILIGCGMGRATETQKFILEFIQNTTKPLIIDADGLNALAEHIQLISQLSHGNWILTPHLGEFKRLVKEKNFDNPLELARKYAKAWNCVLILKGMPSLIALPDGQVFINPTGNSVLSKAGTGDILAGFCAGLLSQGLSPKQAALCATYLGGAAADKYLQKHHQASFLASDLLKELDTVLQEL